MQKIYKVFSGLIGSLIFKFKLLLRAGLFATLIIALKWLFLSNGIEFIHVNSLWSALMSATIFIFGFILSGVLVDYKEAEKMPVEMVASLETMNDEFSDLFLSKKLPAALDCKMHLKRVTDSLLKWFTREAASRSYLVTIQISKMNSYIDKLVPHLAPASMARIKLEKDNLRKNLLRTKIIRETSFAISLYTILELLVFIITALLLFTKFETSAEAFFYTGIFTFILIYLIIYIRDMDNPFDYYDNDQTSDEVSLEPLYFFQDKLNYECRIFGHIDGEKLAIPSQVKLKKSSRVIKKSGSKLKSKKLKVK